MTEDESIKEAEAIIDAELMRLVEHFDAIQILCTRIESDLTGKAKSTTRFFQRGTGNWYARRGMVQEFLEDSKATSTATALKDALE